jgi:superfamily II DNA or RNA helicase
MISKPKNAKKLSDPQIEALDHINNAFNRKINPICALGPGLGKTFVACEIIWYTINKYKNNYRILIVHKASNYKTWEKELRSNFIKNETKEPIHNPSEYINIHGVERKNIFLEANISFLIIK